MRSIVRFAWASALLLVVACSSSTPGQPDTGKGTATPITPITPTTPSTTVPASAGHSLVYADDLETVLLVNAGLGGMTSPAANERTKIWAWSGARWTVLDSAGPPVRNLAGVVYDTRRHVLVMHGGTYDLGRSYGETWEWSRTSGWRQITAAGPGIRDHTQMAFDPERARAVLFGGSGTDPNVAFSDTWEFDGTRWERVATTGPAARVHHAMQYDPALRRVVLFGGFTPGSPPLGDTWTWDGTRWTSLPPTAPPRTHARLAFHRRLNKMLILGGMNPPVAMVRNDNGWASLAVSGEPDARYLPDAAYDTKRDVLVLFGGGPPTGNTLFADTWEFDGTSWSRKS